MTTTTTTDPPARARRVSLEWIAPAILAVAALVMVVILSGSHAGPGHDHGREPDRRPGHRERAGPADDGWLGIGTVDPLSRATVESVIDLGDVWRFRLTVGPDRIGEIRRTADQLRAADWTVTIPADAADRLPLARRS